MACGNKISDPSDQLELKIFFTEFNQLLESKIYYFHSVCSLLLKTVSVKEQKLRKHAPLSPPIPTQPLCLLPLRLSNAAEHVPVLFSLTDS